MKKLGEDIVLMRKRESMAALNTLRTYLWQGAAAAIVGAGFSKNAVRKDLDKPLPPEWDVLSERFAQLLLGIENSTDNNTRGGIARYIQGKNPMVLAYECQAVFGRSTMIDVVKGLIDDNNLLPSKVHEKFLELKWADVYTTNYDTLLERTAASIHDINYKLVAQVGDIVGSSQRRIVKLHGTWNGPIDNWVVTDEDYRLYPKRFAPFVNMVRQSAMEACLCLVGFSGTDPNFLAWIGWVRDNLGEAGLPIYMFTDKTFSQSEYQWLSYRRIIPINIFDVVDDGLWGNYEGALLEIFKYLDPDEREGVELPNNKAWGLLEDRSAEEKKGIVLDWVKSIETYKATYPQWQVAPYSLRRRINNIPGAFERAFELALTFDDAQGNHAIATLFWYYSLCLETLNDSLYRVLLAFWQKYKKIGLKPNDATCLNESVSTTDVIFGLARAARERAEYGLWNEIFEFLMKQKKIDLNRLYYEQALMLMSNVDGFGIKKCIEKWREIEKSEAWKVRFASVLLGLGRFDEAKAVLERALNDIRSKTPRGKASIKKYYLSLEGVTLVLLRRINYREGREATTKTEARLEELSEYECNPLEELDKFGLMFGGSFSIQKRHFTERNFDRSFEFTHYGYVPSKESIQAGVFLHYLEETGMPFISGHLTLFDEKWLGKCIQWYQYEYRSNIAAHNWLVANMGDKLINLTYSERAIAKLSAGNASQMLSNRLEMMKAFVNDLATTKNLEYVDYNRKVLRYSLEVASRLSCRTTDNDKLVELLEIGAKIFVLSGKNDKFNIRSLAPNFFRRVESAIPVEILVEHLPALFSCVVPRTPISSEYERLSSLSPLQGRRMPLEYKPSEMILAYVADLFEKAKLAIGEDEQDAILKLTYLDSLGILNSKARIALAELFVEGYESNRRIVNEYNLSYLTDILSVAGAPQKLLEKCISNRMAQLPAEQHMDSIEENLYSDFVRAFGYRNSKNGHKYNLECWPQLWTHVKTRIETLVAVVNNREVVQNDDFVGTIGNIFGCLDLVIGDVIIPIGSDNAFSQVVELKEKIESQIDIRQFPLMMLSLYWRSCKWEDGIDFIRSYSLFDKPKELCRLLVAFEYLAYQIDDSCPLVDEIGQFLANLFLNSRDISFMFVCRAIAVWISRFKSKDKLLHAIYPGLNRLINETEYDSSNRFPNEDVADYREWVAFLYGVIWAIVKEKENWFHKLLYPLINMWRDRCESDLELWRVRRSWEAGTKFAA